MKIILAAQKFINNNVQYNKNKILSAMETYAQHGDLLVFGEAFLQGFNSLSWNYNEDKKIAITQEHPIITEIATMAKRCNLGVSFGYIEQDEDMIFCSQITIDNRGHIINNYRRISAGWKNKLADFHYWEGDDFKPFKYLGKKIVVALCGDLWFEENCHELKHIKPDIILWPVYTDFTKEEWETAAKVEYVNQASKTGSAVLYVNSLDINQAISIKAQGGLALFSNGHILTEAPLGKEAFLGVEIE